MIVTMEKIHLPELLSEIDEYIRNYEEDNRNRRSREWTDEISMETDHFLDDPRHQELPY